MVARLLPPGVDWQTIDPRVTRLLAGLGRVFLRWDGTAEDFARDAIPTRAEDPRLAEWEAALALPDLDYPPTGTDDERRAEIARVLAQHGPATPAVFIALADLWGLEATVWEPEGWPDEAWLVGPGDHVSAFRIGVTTIGTIALLQQSDTWLTIMRLAARWCPAHVRLHTVDAVT
jgi:hypothetical protein